MFDKWNTGDDELRFLARLARPGSRRTFLKWSGVAVGVAAVGCGADRSAGPSGPGPVAGSGTGSAKDPIHLGSGDVMVLNFAYALEQLESAFYTQVMASPYGGMTDAEHQVLDDVRKHENVHARFLGDALGSSAIPALSVDFSTVNFSDRDSVLTTARTFEDLGVSAYNGAGKYLENLDYLTVAGKIVSVEARHASAIRDLLAPKTAAFAGDDVVNEQGLDVVRTPAEVFTLADPFITSEIDASTLPAA